MQNSHDSDQQFHENLQAMCGGTPVPDDMSDGLRGRCEAAFQSPQRASGGLLRKPAFLSTLGLAAVVALAVGLFPFGTGGTTVEAATILAKFNEQIAEPQLIEITMDSIVIEEVSLDGYLQVANGAVAGDLHVRVAEGGPDEVVEVDISLGLSANESWVLLRKLSIPDPQVQAMLGMFFPEGSELLLTLPTDMTADDLDLDLGNMLGELQSAHGLLETFTEMLQEQPESGATITEQHDGTVVLTLPITDVSALEAYLKVAIEAGKAIGEVDEGEDVDIDINDFDDDDIGLLGSTIQIVYDPDNEVIRSFSLTDFGANKGTLSIGISDDEIDANLLDSDRVKGPNTRSFDLGALKTMFEGFDFGK